MDFEGVEDRARRRHWRQCVWIEGVLWVEIRLALRIRGGILGFVWGLDGGMGVVRYMHGASTVLNQAAKLCGYD